MHRKGSDGQDNFRKSAGGNVAEELEERRSMRWRRRRRSRRRRGVMVDWWRSYEAVKRNVTPGHFLHCRALCKVRLAGPQGALTLSLWRR